MRLFNVIPTSLTLLLQLSSIVQGALQNDRRAIANATSQEVPRGTFSTSSFKNVSVSAYQEARALVDQALKDWAVYNKARFEKPARNKYTLRPENPDEARAQDVSPIITKEIASAAALLAEMKAPKTITNFTRPAKQAANKFWMAGVDHLGTQPYGGDTSYKVRMTYQITRH
jgi:hypothetical protein